MHTQNFPLVAGKSAGKRIRCATQLQPVFDRLQQAALRGSHWPRIAIRELNALSTGLLNQKNVYVRAAGGSRDSSGNSKYVVFLPGLKASVVRWPNDDYCITELVLDENYFEATGDQTKRLGLYRVRPQRNGWTTQFVNGSQILSERNRIVAVADSGFDDANRTANTTVPKIMKSPVVVSSNVRNNGCDLHFTPGKRKLGSLVRYDAIHSDRSRASAVQLAETMALAKEIKDVAWVADSGGSLVLTQAMQILAERGITLRTHTAYLYKPRSSPGDAVRLAHKLELSLNEESADVGWSPRGAWSQVAVSATRVKKENDPYTLSYHAHAWTNGVIKVGAPATILVMGAAAYGTPVPMLAGIVAAISGGGAAYTVGQSLAETARRKLNR